MYRECFLCGRNGWGDPLEEHHIFFGTSNRKNSEARDVTVYLCANRCHRNGPQAAHNNHETAEMLKRYGQRKVMLRDGLTVEEFRMIFGKNHLDEDEIEEIYAIQRGEIEEEPDGYEALDERMPEWICA